MKRVVTIAREHGSGGQEIARRAAAALGFRLVDRSLLEEVARRAELAPEDAEVYDERVNPWMVQIAKALAAGSADSYAAAMRGAAPDSDLLVELTRRVVIETAQEGGAVILGRGAQCILGRREDALHVFVFAPVEDRVARLVGREGGESGAIAAIEKADRARAEYVRHYYGCDRTSLALYDLLINSRMGVDAAVRLIVCAVRGSGDAP
jgi:CMP/dCMP kinase